MPISFVISSLVHDRIRTLLRDCSNYFEMISAHKLSAYTSNGPLYRLSYHHLNDNLGITIKRPHQDIASLSCCGSLPPCESQENDLEVIPVWQLKLLFRVGCFQQCSTNQPFH